MSQLFESAETTALCVVEEQWHDTTVVVSCSGVVDMLTAPELERRISVVLDKEPDALIIDFTAVDFLASAGMSVLIKTHDQITPAVRFAVVADSPVTSRPMKLIGLTDLITMYPTVDAALDIGPV